MWNRKDKFLVFLIINFYRSRNSLEASVHVNQHFLEFIQDIDLLFTLSDIKKLFTDHSPSGKLEITFRLTQDCFRFSGVIPCSYSPMQFMNINYILDAILSALTGKPLKGLQSFVSKSVYSKCHFIFFDNFQTYDEILFLPQYEKRYSNNWQLSSC